MPHEPLELRGHLLQAHLEIDPLLRAEILGRQQLASQPSEAPAELLQLVAPNGEPRGHVVAAVALEQVAAGQQGAVQVEPRDAPPGALPDVAVERDEEGGSAVPLDHAGGHDPHHAGMPALTRQHECRVVGTRGGLDLGQRLVEDPLIQRLALDVEPLQTLSQAGRLRRIVGEEKPKTVGGVADPSRRVEPAAPG